MPNDEENDSGLNVPVAAGSKVDEALRALLKVISDTPGTVKDFQIHLNVSSSGPVQESNLEFTAGSYIRQVIPDANNPGTTVIRLAFLSDKPQADIEFDLKNHPNPGDKATWKRLLGDPPGIDIDDGITYMRMDRTASNFMIAWLPNNVGGQQPIWKIYTKPGPSIGPQPTVDLDSFVTCLDQNSNQAIPSRVSQCISSL